MSVQAITWALETDLGQNYAAKVLLLALANYADEHNSCFPGREKISAETGLSLRTISRHVQGLIELGLLQVERRYKGKTRTSDRYILCLGANLARANHDEKEGGLHANCGVHIEEPPVIEPTDNSSKPEKRDSYPQDFLEFWREYPTDPNMSKKTAFTRWKKLDSEKRQQAIRSLPSFQAHCKANDWYRPVHACKYLSDERFEGFQGGQALGDLDIEEINRQLQA